MNNHNEMEKAVFVYFAGINITVRGEEHPATTEEAKIVAREAGMKFIEDIDPDSKGVFHVECMVELPEDGTSIITPSGSIEVEMP